MEDDTDAERKRGEGEKTFSTYHNPFIHQFSLAQ
jgi:hypothetical protein